MGFSTDHNKVSRQSANALIQKATLSLPNTKVYEEGGVWYMDLFDNQIAKKEKDGSVWICDGGGWVTPTTRARLNSIPGVSLGIAKRSWRLNGQSWDGKWIKVNQPDSSKVSPIFNSVAMVAAMGNLLCETKEEKNTWKLRMLKAGMGSAGLQIPDDWDTLSEDEKEKRLDNVIEFAKK